MATELDQRVVNQLDEVLDPCSCMTDNPVSIVDLGLVNEIEWQDGSVDIELLPTTPMCMYMTQIMDEAEEEVLKLDDVEEVEITQNVEDIWRPERMDDELLEAKRERFEAGVQAQDVPDMT